MFFVVFLYTALYKKETKECGKSCTCRCVPRPANPILLLFDITADMPTLPISEGDSLFLLTFVSILTPKFGNLTITDKVFVIEGACNFENLPIFCLNHPYFLDVNVGISVTGL